MTRKVKVLDHGYVKFIEAWGRGEVNRIYDHMQPKVDMECGIIEAARQSTQGSFREWESHSVCTNCGRVTDSGTENIRLEAESCVHEWKAEAGDQKLLSFLFNSKPQHSTPFEFAGMIIEVQAPLFVFREWHRHRTQSYNEMSARYTKMPNLHYVPTVERIIAASRKSGNKQASGKGILDDGMGSSEEIIAEAVRTGLAEEQQTAYEHYETLLAYGIAPEVARVNTPVSRYSKMRASANLRSWLAFMTLRHDPGAQWEIQQFAAEVGNVIKAVFPRVHKLFEGGRAEEKAMRAVWKALSQEKRDAAVEATARGSAIVADNVRVIDHETGKTIP